MATIGLKKLEIADEIRKDESLSAKVRTATDLLIQELGASAPSIEADWKICLDEKKGRLVELRISDFTGTASGRLSDEQLADTSDLQWRLSRMWGDLLQDRSHRQLESLHTVVEELSDH